MTTDIAMFGIFRSGTNYMRTVMEWNYDCRLINDAYGWKHGFFPSISPRSPMQYPDLPVLTVARNPFMALYSLQRYNAGIGKAHIDAKIDMSDFLRNRIIIHDSTNANAPEFRFANPVEFWNSMNWHYQSIKPRGLSAHTVRYEDALSKPEATAEELAGIYGLMRTSKAFAVPDQRTKNMHDGIRKTIQSYLRPNKFDEKRFFLNGEYMSAFTDEDRAFVARAVDKELADRLDYGGLIARLMGERTWHQETGISS